MWCPLDLFIHLYFKGVRTSSVNWILWSLSIRVKLPQASQCALCHRLETLTKKKVERLCALQRFAINERSPEMNRK